MQITKEQLFDKFKLNFHTLSAYMSAVYDHKVLENLSLENVRDSLSDGQTASKLWVINELSKIPDIEKQSIGIFGGWVGLLCKFCVDYLGTKSIANIEIDKSLSMVNYYIMSKHAFDFEFINSDMYQFEYYDNIFDIYVNTSGEHIHSIKDWVSLIPARKIVCIQSNNYFAHEQHINCVNNVDELVDKLNESVNIKEILYAGTLSLPIYNRFMVIAKT